MGRLLVRYSRRREPRTFAALFDAMAAEMFQVALRLAPDAPAAEDALQETFLFVLEHAQRYDPARPARPWLLGVLRRKIQEVRRRVQRAPDPLRVHPPLAPDGPVDAAHRREEAECIRRALESLPEPYRAVGLLRWRHGLAPAEIAELRGEPPGTVRATLSRALKQLRVALGSLALFALLGGVARGLPAIRSLVLGRSTLMKGVWMFKKLAAAAAVLIGLLATWWVVSNTAKDRAPARTTHAEVPTAAPGAPDAPAVEGFEPQAAKHTAHVTVCTLDGRPIAGAHVACRRVTPARPMRVVYDPAVKPSVPVEATTDVTGGAVVAGLEPGSWAFEAVAAGRARGSTRQNVHGDLEVVLRLGSGHTLQGVVRETDGTPVPGVLVASGTIRAASDAQGRYRLEALSWGPTRLVAARPGGAVLEVARVLVPDVTHFDIVLAPAATLAGRVTDADTGDPLPGVRVRAGIFFGHRGAGEATTGADGRYEIRTLREGIVNQLGATRDGWIKVSPRGRPRIPVRGHETTVRDIAMRRAPNAPPGKPQVVGRVLGPDGPLAGARVVAGGRRAVTNAAGEFELRGLGTRPVSLQASFRGHYQGEQIEVVPGARVEVHLRRGRTLAGYAESTAGAPLAGASVGRAITNERGEFVLEGIVPGPAHELYVTCDGYVRTTLKVGFESETPLQVRLTPTPRVAGTVRPAPGASLHDTYARVFVATGRARSGPGGGQETLVSERAPVREDGAYEAEIPWADSGTFRVEVYSPEHVATFSRDQRLEPGRQDYAVDVALDAAETVRGRVVVAGTKRPVAGASIAHNGVVLAVTDGDGRFDARGRPGAWLTLSASGYVTRNARNEDPFVLEPALEIRGRVVFADGRPVIGQAVRADGPVRGSADTDDEGAFRIGGLGVGAYTVALVNSSLVHAPAENVHAGAADVRLVVRAPPRVRGRVVDEQRRPLAGIVVRAGTGRAVTARDGTFALAAPDDAAHTLVINPPAQGPYQQGGDFVTERRAGVRAGAPPIEITLKRGQVVDGHLVDEAGRPYAGVWLALAGRTLTTDAEGGFVFHGIPPGAHNLRIPASHNLRGLRLLGPGEIQAGTRDLRVVATAGETLRGRVVDATGAAVAAADVVARDADGRVRRARTGPDGTFEITGVHASRVEVNVTADGYAEIVRADVVVGGGDVRLVVQAR